MGSARHVVRFGRVHWGCAVGRGQASCWVGACTRDPKSCGPATGQNADGRREGHAYPSFWGGSPSFSFLRLWHVVLRGQARLGDGGIAPICHRCSLSFLSLLAVPVCSTLALQPGGNLPFFMCPVCPLKTLRLGILSFILAPSPRIRHVYRCPLAWRVRLTAWGSPTIGAVEPSLQDKPCASANSWMLPEGRAQTRHHARDPSKNLDSSVVAFHAPSIRFFGSCVLGVHIRSDADALHGQTLRGDPNLEMVSWSSGRVGSGMSCLQLAVS